MRDTYERTIERTPAGPPGRRKPALLRAVGRIGRTKVFRNFGVYTFGSIFGASVPFLLLPVLTRFLAPADYGLVAMFQVLTGVTSAVAGLSVHGAIGRQYFEEETDFPVYVANCLLILAASATFLVLATFAFGEAIGAAAAFPESWLWAVIVQSVCQFITSVVLVIWQVRGKAVSYATFMLSLIVLNVGASLAFVVAVDLGWRGRILGQVLAYAVFAALGLVFLVRGRWVRLRWSRTYLVNAISFGLPLVPHTLGMWAITMAGRWLVAREVGLDAAGIYLVGAQIGTVIGLLQDAFNKAWVPWFYAELKKETVESKRRIVRITYAYNAAILLLALAISLGAPWVLKFLASPEYATASDIVPWIAFGYAFNGMYKMVTNYTFYVGKTYFLAGGTFITGLINIVLGYALVRTNGAVGAAQATAVSFCFSYIFTAIVAAKLYPMPSMLREA